MKSGNHKDATQKIVICPQCAMWLLSVSLYLHWCQLDGGDVGGVHHGLWAVGSVRQEALPLLWQPGELLLPRIEARVDPVLKIRWS